MLRKSSIIAINGCVNKILNSRRIDVHKTIGVWDVLKEHKTFATDPFRLDSDGERCVVIIRNKINEELGE